MDLADTITFKSIAAFNKLAKSGKPQNTEWTVLSTISMQRDGIITVISLGTGCKCLSKSKMSTEGTLINDSHAEIIARRGFLKWIYDQLLIAIQGSKESLFTLNPSSLASEEESPFVLKEGITFHLYTSQPPCGDATIFQTIKKETKDDIKESKVENIIDVDEDDKGEKPSKKRQKVSHDGYNRTGAHLMSSFEINVEDESYKHHVIGQLRTKPGRGDSTLSLSCSDKISLWSIIGIQGALLSLLIPPLYLASITIGEGFNLIACERAFISRISSFAFGELPHKGYKVNILTCNRPTNSSPFPFSQQQRGSSCHPSGTSLNFQENNKSHEVTLAAFGMKQGSVKKEISANVQSHLCSKHLFNKFCEVVYQLTVSTISSKTEKSEERKNHENLNFMLKGDHQSYMSMKLKASVYQCIKSKFLSFSVFSHWKQKEMETYYNFYSSLIKKN